MTVTQNTDTIDISGDSDLFISDAAQTTDATATGLQFNGSIPEPSTGKTWFFEVRAIGVATSGEKQAFKVEGVVTNASGTKSLVGTNAKVDYQRSTSDTAQALWDPMSSYNSGDVVEYNLNIYEAQNTITGGYLSNNLSPDQDSTNWTATYTGWNVNAEVIGGAFRVRVKGSAGKTVNWKVRFTKVEV